MRMVVVRLLAVITKIQSIMPADRIHYARHSTGNHERKWHAKDAFEAVVRLMIA